jgi:copper chaperone NosL
MKNCNIKLGKSIFIALALVLTACNTNTPAIEFGKDSCWFCKMTVIDKKFGGVLINSKGKSLKFDSGECMVAYMNADNTFRADKILVVDYNTGKLIDARKAFFLHGGTVNSPMGGQLAAFGTAGGAEQLQKKSDGNVLQWQTVVKTKF